MTEPQHLQALGIANAVRLRRADEKRKAKEGTAADGLRFVAGLIDRNPPHLNTAVVADLLQWPRRMGAMRANRMLFAGGISPGRRLGDLSDRQRRWLANELALQADAVDTRSVA